MSKLVVYKASAGSGKTFTLAVSYIKLLIQNTHAYREILAVTFTNKATAEMKERIISQLYGIWRRNKDSESYLNVIKGQLDEEFPNQYSEEDIRRRAGEALTYMLHDYNRFKVTTIDSFFQSVMRNLARELDLSPNLNIELNGMDVVDEAVDSMIEQLSASSQVLAWLIDYIEEKITDNKSWNVSREIKAFAKNILNENYQERGEGLQEKLRNPKLIPEYKKTLRAIEKEALEQMKGFYDQFMGELESNGLEPGDLKNGSRGIGSYFNKINRGELGGEVRNKTVEKCLESPEEWAKKTGDLTSIIVDLAATSLMPLLKDAEEFRTKNNFIVNSCRLSTAHLNKLQLLAHIDNEMRLLNKQQNRFLLSDTNALLRGIVNEGDSSFIFEKIGANIRSIMIDEFQDTSRMQWQNFKLLLLEGLSQGADSLIVGDVKQSIYRWRSGDWTILNRLGDEERTFEQFPIDKKTLDTNRRSESNIIHFNNVLFPTLIFDLNGRFREENNEDCHALLNAYSDVAQISPKESAKGFVQITSVAGENAEEYVDATLQKLVEEVNHLLAQGVNINDIAILVRKNKAIPQIAEYFNKNVGITIVSDEAFRLDASTSINTLINALRLLSEPKDEIVLSELVITYQKEILKSTESNEHFLLSKERESFLPEAFIKNQKILRELPLYELLEKLFSIFELSKLEEQDAYLFSFFDKVMRYLDSESSLLEDFLEYWDDRMCSETIPSGEIEGIRILSIHKSKGLEFHTVLLPFTDWALETDRNDQLVWCETDVPPFNEIDIVPINYNKAMNESVYSSSYQEERLQLWVDNINLLYVALTRAGSNLCIYTKESDTRGISSLINSNIANIAQKQEVDWNPESPYQYGKVCPSKVEDKKESENIFLAASEKEAVKMETFAHQFDFRQSNKSADFIDGLEEEESPYRFISRGRLLHELFASIDYIDDIKPAIRKLKFDGLISSTDEERDILALAEHAFSHKDVQEWYQRKWQLFNECSIIYNVDGKLETRRPDRVMVSPDRERAIVVDFKFGKKQKQYTAQVKEYMKLLGKMGYANIEGYIWYVTNDIVERI